MNKQTPAEKAFYILKKNLNVWDMLELVNLLSAYAEEETQKNMAEQL